METEPDYSKLTVDQLRGIERHLNHTKYPERSARLHQALEIAERSPQINAPSTPPPLSEAAAQRLQKAVNVIGGITTLLLALGALLFCSYKLFGPDVPRSPGAGLVSMNSPLYFRRGNEYFITAKPKIGSAYIYAVPAEQWKRSRATTRALPWPFAGALLVFFGGQIYLFLLARSLRN